MSMEGFWWRLALTVLISVGARIVLTDLRRKHRLRAIPGPKPWPIVGNLFQFGPVPHLGIMEMQKKYGPVMKLWFGQQAVLVVNTPQTIKEVMSTYDSCLAQRPTGIASLFLGEGVSWAPFGDAQTFARKICVRELLCATRLKTFQDVRREDRLEALQVILDSARAKIPLDIRMTIRRYLYTDMVRMIMRKDQVDPKMVDAVQTMGKDILHAAYLTTLGDYFPILRALDVGGHVKHMKEVLIPYDAFVTKLLKDRRRQNEEVSDTSGQDPDFVDVLLSLSGRETDKLSDTVIKNLILDVLAPCADGIAEVQVWALVELFKNPLALHKAREELARVVGPERLVEETDVPNLTYIENIVKETMRVHPGGGFAVREARTDVTIGGHHVPAGTYLFATICDVGWQETWWDRPLIFDPDRFERDPKDVSGRQFEYIPFGAGRRSCPGVYLSMLNMVLGLAQLLHVFDLELPNGMQAEEIDEELDLGFVSMKRIPLTILATPRLPNKIYEANKLRV